MGRIRQGCGIVEVRMSGVKSMRGFYVSNRKVLFAIMASNEPFWTPEQRLMQGILLHPQLHSMNQSKREARHCQ